MVGLLALRQARLGSSQPLLVDCVMHVASAACETSLVRLA